jgi:DDE family transposase
MICDCDDHLIISAFATRGPSVDVDTLRRLLFAALLRLGGRRRIGTILADAGYDSESNHRFCRDGCGVRSVIATGIGRPSRKPAAGAYRRRMKRYRDYRFGQRWQIEATVSMIKRNLGAAVAARSFAMQCKEVMLKVLAHNIMLIAAMLRELFYRAGRELFISVRWN